MKSLVVYEKSQKIKGYTYKRTQVLVAVGPRIRIYLVCILAYLRFIYIIM